MRIIVNRKQFLTALELAKCVAPNKSPKPILCCVRIEATEGRAVVCANDLDKQIELDVAADVEGAEGQGVAVVELKPLLAFVKASTDATVQLGGDGSNLTVCDCTSKTKISGYPAKDFLYSPIKGDGKNSYRIPGDALSRLFGLVESAQDCESSRYALGGMKLENADGKLLAIATDGRRLIKAEAELHTVGNPLPFTNKYKVKDKECEDICVVPAASIAVFRKIVAKLKVGSLVNLFPAKDCVTFIGLGFALRARLLEGRYPRWRDVITGNNGANEIEMEVGPLRDAIKRVIHATSEESRGMDFNFDGGYLTLSAGNGAATTKLPVCFNGTNCITLDPRFVTDCLSPLGKTDTIKLRLVDKDTCSHWTRDNYAAVIMPLARDK